MGTNEETDDEAEQTRITASGPSEDAEVAETRDVSETPEEEVDEMVDDMLEDEPDESADDSSEGNVTAGMDEEDVGPNDLTATSPDEVSVEELEEQEWTLGQEIEDQLINFKGTKFLLSEPDDDDVLDIIAQAPGQEINPKANMLKLCQAAIKAPELTASRWEHEMNMSERIGLTMRVSQFMGIEDFMDFPEGGPEAQQGA